MAKHLPPRGAALPSWRAALMPALMWLILLTIFPARLHGEVKVNEPSIVVPTNTPIRLSSLIENGIVEGVEGNDSVYTITASPMTGVNVYDVYGYIRFLSPVTSTITYTNKENPEDSFSVEMTSKYYPGQYIQRYLGTVYIGESKTLTLPDDYFPLSDFTIEHQIIPGYPEGDIECETNGNDMTITGVAEGWVNLLFISKFGTSTWQITVAPKPSVDNIEVKEKSIVVPTRTSITLSSLIQNGIVEGVTGKSEEYSIASSETSGINVTNHDDYLQSVYVQFTAPVTSTITFTHKDYPDVSFSIEMTAKNNSADYLSRNLGTVYVGEPKTLTIPDDYMPLSYFTIQRSMLEPNADFKFEVNGNDITITGVAAGRANLRFTNSYGTVKFNREVRQEI